MAVEIGTLVLRGTFGPARSAQPEQPVDLDPVLGTLKQEILDEVKDLIADTARRAQGD